MAFTDMITTFRGLGILGATLSIIVVACFVMFGSLALDKRFAGGQDTIEYKISQNRDKLSGIKDRMAQTEAKLVRFDELEQSAAELASLQLSIQEKRDANARSRSQVDSLRDEIKYAEDSLAAHKRLYRNMVRERSVGTTMEKLLTLDGKTYHQVTIKSIGAMGMNITHRDGSRRIPFRDLPVDMQRKYMFSEEEAQAQHQKEQDLLEQRRLAQLAHQRAADQQKVEVEKKRDHEQVEEQQRQIENLRMAIDTINQRIRLTEQKINEESSKTISRAPQYREELRKLEKAKREYELRLSRMSGAR